MDISSFKLEQIDNKYYLFLPKETIEDYDRLKTIMSNIFGKYGNLKKKPCFIFTYDPKPFLDEIQNGKYPNIKKDIQFFETSKEVWFKVFDAVATVFKPYMKICEPSAGRGSMISALAEWHISNWCMSQFLSYQIHLIEAYEPNRAYLKEKSDRYMKMCMPLFLTPDYDFLKTNTKNKYDLILANPPFAKGQAEAHLTKMLSHLSEEGVLAVILPESVKEKIVELTKGYRTKIVELEKGDFKKSGTNVKCFILVVSMYALPDVTVPKPHFKLRIPEIEGKSPLMECDKDGNELAIKPITNELLSCFYLPETEKTMVAKTIDQPKKEIKKPVQLSLF